MSSRGSLSVRWKSIGLWAGLVMVSLGCSGCRSQNAAPKPTSSEAGNLVRANVVASLERIAKVPAEAKQEISILIESLEGYARDFRGPFESLLAVAKEVQGEIQNASDAKGIQNATDKLKAALENLPLK